MGHALELDQRARGSIREGVWVTRRTWNRTEEATPRTDLWTALANPMALRRSVARDFASAVGEHQAVEGIWLTGLHDDLDIAVTLKDPEAESEIRATFIDLVCDRLDPSEGELFVFPSDAVVPAWVGRGEKLVP